jgi:hypothetical protein
MRGMLISGAVDRVEEWGAEHFSGTPLGDVRRARRAVVLANAFASNPGVSIPHLFKEPYQVQAAYDFLSRPEATPDNIQSTHRERVGQAMCASRETVLLIQDTTTFSWSGKDRIEGLGPIGNGNKGQQGFHCHSVLAVRVLSPGVAGWAPAVQLLGLADQQYLVRTPSGARGEAKAQRHGRWRESMRWAQAVQRVGAAPKGCRWIDVADRESDIYEHMLECSNANHGFVIRANQNRSLLDPDCSHVFEAAAAAPILGSYTIDLHPRPGRAARKAQVVVRSCPVHLRPPHRHGTQFSAIKCSVIEARENDAPAGAEPVHWVLLSDQDATSYEQAIELIGYYSARWLIEEFHKAVKSGLGAERLQLEHVDRLQAAISIMSVVALRLLDLREQLRQRPKDAAETVGLDPLELQVLRKLLPRKTITTVEDVAYAIGRLGGHLSHNGPPGWKTLMLGMMEIISTCRGVHLAKELKI